MQNAIGMASFLTQEIEGMILLRRGFRVRLNKRENGLWGTRWAWFQFPLKQSHVAMPIRVFTRDEGSQAKLLCNR